MAKKELPEVNASSMADIAFLLLTFFLVATSINVDKGVRTTLTYKDPKNPPPKTEVKMRNVYTIRVESNGGLLVEDEIFMDKSQISELREMIKKHIINNGNGSCKECYYTNSEGATVRGERKANLSEEPSEAVILLQNKNTTPYRVYLSVFNEIKAAYAELRDDVAQRKYGRSYKDLPDGYSKNGKIYKEEEDKKKEVRTIFKEIIVEADPIE
ncbi:MAG: ExbD/TolR family protein [Flavobacteriales bacterium]